MSQPYSGEKGGKFYKRNEPFGDSDKNFAQVSSPRENNGQRFSEDKKFLSKRRNQGRYHIRYEPIKQGPPKDSGDPSRSNDIEIDFQMIDQINPETDLKIQSNGSNQMTSELKSKLGIELERNQDNNPRENQLQDTNSEYPDLFNEAVAGIVDKPSKTGHETLPSDIQTRDPEQTGQEKTGQFSGSPDNPEGEQPKLQNLSAEQHGDKEQAENDADLRQVNELALEAKSNPGNSESNTTSANHNQSQQPDPRDVTTQVETVLSSTTQENAQASSLDQSKTIPTKKLESSKLKFRAKKTAQTQQPEGKKIEMEEVSIHDLTEQSMNDTQYLSLNNSLNPNVSLEHQILQDQLHSVLNLSVNNPKKPKYAEFRPNQTTALETSGFFGIEAVNNQHEMQIAAHNGTHSNQTPLAETDVAGGGDQKQYLALPQIANAHSPALVGFLIVPENKSDDYKFSFVGHSKEVMNRMQNAMTMVLKSYELYLEKKFEKKFARQHYNTKQEVGHLKEFVKEYMQELKNMLNEVVTTNNLERPAGLHPRPQEMYGKFPVELRLSKNPVFNLNKGNEIVANPQSFDVTSRDDSIINYEEFASNLPKNNAKQKQEAEEEEKKDQPQQQQLKELDLHQRYNYAETSGSQFLEEDGVFSLKKAMEKDPELQELMLQLQNPDGVGMTLDLGHPLEAIKEEGKLEDFLSSDEETKLEEAAPEHSLPQQLATRKKTGQSIILLNVSVKREKVNFSKFELRSIYLKMHCPICSFVNYQTLQPKPQSSKSQFPVFLCCVCKVQKMRVRFFEKRKKEGSQNNQDLIQQKYWIVVSPFLKELPVLEEFSLVVVCKECGSDHKVSKLVQGEKYTVIANRISLVNDFFINLGELLVLQSD